MSIYLAFINITATLTLRFIRAATMRSSGPDQVIYVEAYADTTADTDLVVNTECHHYIQRYRPNEAPDAAAKAMETTKRDHYSAVKDPPPLPLPLPPASIILMLETSGRLGSSAVGFVQRISGAHTYLRSQFF